MPQGLAVLAFLRSGTRILRRCYADPPFVFRFFIAVFRKIQYIKIRQNDTAHIDRTQGVQSGFQSDTEYQYHVEKGVAENEDMDQTGLLP